MDLKEYQEFTATTAQYPGRGHITGLLYLLSKLQEEVGEFSGKIGKKMRDEGITALTETFGKGDWIALEKELGDIAWYCSELATHFGFSLSHVLTQNKEKLEIRLKNNTIKGAGDER